jgi:hypothetical protein
MADAAETRRIEDKHIEDRTVEEQAHIDSVPPK